MEITSRSAMDKEINTFLLSAGSQILMPPLHSLGSFQRSQGNDVDISRFSGLTGSSGIRAWPLSERSIYMVLTGQECIHSQLQSSWLHSIVLRPGNPLCHIYYNRERFRNKRAFPAGVSLGFYAQCKGFCTVF